MAGLKPGVAYALAAVLVCSVIVVWLVRRAPPSTPPGPSKGQLAQEAGERLARQAANYDWERSKRNLEMIGAEIQRERKKHKLKPASEWRTAKDVGLESLYSILVRVPQEWCWVEGSTMPRGGGTATVLTQYTCIFDAMDEVLTPEELRQALTTRGESLPVAFDHSMYRKADLTQFGETADILVLRLDGTVDRVKFRTLRLYSDPGYKDFYFKL